MRTTETSLEKQKRIRKRHFARWQSGNLRSVPMSIRGVLRAMEYQLKTQHKEAAK